MTALIIKVVLFADIAGSTQLYASLGTRAASTLIETSLQTCREAVDAEGGRVVKFLGDGILAVFDETDSAVCAAIKIQKRYESGEIRFKIGIDAGTVIDADADFYGDVVGLAARLCDKAHKGEILASEAVVLGAAVDIIKSSQNPLSLKGYARPIAVYSIEAPDEAFNVPTRIVFKQSVVASHARISDSSGTLKLTAGIAHPEIVVGRPSNAPGDIHLSIARNSVSRQHALIKWSAGTGFNICDTSRNGTFIRTSNHEVRQVHRANSPLDQTSWISFGEELPEGDFDILFELIDSEN